MSLFSFQDIVTATTGILILLALVLALSVIIQGADSPVEAPVATAKEFALQDALQVEIESLKEKSRQMANMSASLASSSPAELKRKSNEAAKEIVRLRRAVEAAESTLKSQKMQFKDLQSQSDADALHAELLHLEAVIEKTNLKISQLKADDRVIYNFRENEKSAWLVQISGTEILAGRASVEEAPRSFASAPAFNKFATQLRSEEQYFVLLVKPSGMKNHDVINDFLVERGLELGVELIGERQTVVDPVKGASFQ